MSTDLAIALALLLGVDKPKPLGVWDLRRRAGALGVRSINGRQVKYARRDELLKILSLQNNG